MFAGIYEDVSIPYKEINQYSPRANILLSRLTSAGTGDTYFFSFAISESLSVTAEYLMKKGCTYFVVSKADSLTRDITNFFQKIIGS